MTQSVFARLRIVGPLTIAAALGIGTLPALAAETTMALASPCSGIHFELANPSPGSMLEPGGIVLQGVATDARAQGSLGVDRVDFFLDDRDQGGINLGTAVPGMVPGPFGPASFQTTVSIPKLTGGHDLVAYAHSTVSGGESVVSVPVIVGEDPSKVGEVGTTESSTCLGGSSSVTSPSATTPATTPASPSTTPAAAAMTPATAPSSATISLQVYNPSSGDTIHAGGYTVEGVAMDKAAQTGSGIDRIDIFLDDRDAGGMRLTDAIPGPDGKWQVNVPLPTNQTGLHTLVFYARSAVTGREDVVSIPVTIDP